MNLLAFAHRGEAQVFLKNLEFKPVDIGSIELYQSSEELLLIHGEGTQSTTQALSFALGLSQFNIQKIINLGISATIDSTVNKDEIVQVRTSYKNISINNTEMEFKTFSSNYILKDLKQVDCITTNTRVLDKNSVEKIAPFGQIVDREIWAIGSVARQFKKDFCSIKYISDSPSVDSEICQRIKDNAENFSDQLYRTYLKYFKESKDTPKLQENKLLADLLKSKDLYFTLSMERRLNQLVDSLTLKGLKQAELYESIKLNNIIEDETHKKSRASIVLEKLHELLNPFNANLKNLFINQTSELNSSGIKVKTSKNLESSKTFFNFEIDSANDFRSKIEKLNEFDYKRVDDLLNGKTDV